MRDLGRLVRVREIWERREKAHVARAMETARRAQEAATARADEHTHALGTDVGGPILNHTARTATWEALARSQVQAQAAALQEEASRGVWRRAKQDLEITERLEDRRKQAEALEAGRRDTKTLDEIASNRHGRPE